MRHTYECPMRWADMDLLGHVNNVVYVEYLAEARENLFPGLPAGRAPVAGHQVEFLSPLVFHRHPVLVDTWVTEVDSNELTLAHEVYDVAEDGARSVYLRASTVLAHRVTEAESDVVDRLRGPTLEWRTVSEGPGESRHVYPVKVRVSDLDEHRRASDVIHFEYFQEARIQYLMSLHTRGQKWSNHVVARTDVDYRSPVPFREPPYAVHSWIGHVGTNSFTIRAELRDEDSVLATASVVMVTFDMETQRPTGMADTQRARLTEELPA